MNREDLQTRYDQQQFANGYELIDGVQMNRENPDHFQIPPNVLKRHIGPGHFVELRVDSPRFSVHEDAPEKCTCASCLGEATKPILSHENPASLVTIPIQPVPSRGWGEDFWVKVTERGKSLFVGEVDNWLYESRLHGLEQGTPIVFREEHVLAVHGSHRRQIVSEMNESDLRELLRWLATQ